MGTTSRVGTSALLGGLTRKDSAPEPYSEEPAVAVEIFSPGLGQVRSLGDKRDAGFIPRCSTR